MRGIHECLIAFANVMFDVKCALDDCRELWVVIFHLVLKHEPRDTLIHGVFVFWISLCDEARAKLVVAKVAKGFEITFGPKAHGRQPLVQVTAARRATSKRTLLIPGELFRLARYGHGVRLDVVGLRVHLEGNRTIRPTKL